jgi:3-oxoacyl-[acyl-carrier protein] reductase
VVAAAVAAFGRVDILVCNHARSGLGGLGQLTADDLDAMLAVNTRAPLLLVQAFAAQHDGRPGGRVVLLTSGQHLGPMAASWPTPPPRAPWLPSPSAWPTSWPTAASPSTP